MVVGLLGNESPDSDRITLATLKSENDVRLRATLGSQNPTGLPVGAVSHVDDVYHIFDVGFRKGTKYTFLHDFDSDLINPDNTNWAYVESENGERYVRDGTRRIDYDIGEKEMTANDAIFKIK